jgi:hypothetical protein
MMNNHGPMMNNHGPHLIHYPPHHPCGGGYSCGGVLPAPPRYPQQALVPSKNHQLKKATLISKNVFLYYFPVRRGIAWPLKSLLPLMAWKQWDLYESRAS